MCPVDNGVSPPPKGAAGDPRLIGLFETVADILSLATLLLGVSVFTGWALDIPALKSVFPGLVTMKVNTALVFILLSAAGLMLRSKRMHKPGYRLSARICSSISILIGALILFEYALGWDVGIDQLIIKEGPDAAFTTYPGRPSPLTALNFVLIGLALLSIDARIWHGIRPSHATLFPAGIISMLCFISHLYGIPHVFYFLPGSSAMALHTAFGFLLSTAAILFARPAHGVTAIFISDTSGGVLTRRMFFPTVFILIILGFLEDAGIKAGLYDTRIGQAAHATFLIAFFSGTIIALAKALENADLRGKRADAALRESEIKWRELFMISPVGVSILDKNGKVAECNPELEKILGITQEHLRNGEYQERKYLRPDNSPMPPVEFPSTVAIREQRIVRHVEIGVVKENGTTIWTDVSAAPLPFHGAACVIVTADITESKAKREKLKAAKDDAEAATLLKDKFVSLVSHDLKSPLSAMIGFLKLVKNDTGEPLNEGAELILSSAIRSGTQMANLIDDLLSISRLRTGQVKLSKQFFDAKYLGINMINDYSGLARQKGIEMENAIPENSRIYADKSLLTEAIRNLITNAIKFCISGDRITISLAKDEVSTICVRDTGPGIPPELMENLFKYERKTSTKGTAGETGSGLGLPLVKDIMEFHGGKLEVTSESGKGSLFSLKLPYMRPIILLVDDDKGFRYLQVLNLKEMNAAIIEAEHGEEALKMMEKVHPHLIITDIKMPIMDGLELLKSVRAKPDTKDIPVIVVSGEYGMEIRDTIFKLGADDFATKDIDTVDFLPRVRRFIG